MEEIDLLLDSCNKMEININKKQLNQFMDYKKLLLIWNEKVNLTAITQADEIISKHFVDCISILCGTKIGQGASIIDVGTGAGFPGVPLKIMRPDISITLLDSLNKRISFLEALVAKLEINGVLCVHSRAEDGGKNPLYREKFDFCVSRAVANLAVLSEYCLPFIKVGGFFISLKGPDINEEIEAAKKAIQVLGGSVEKVVNIQIPHTDIKHSLVMIKKLCQTPAQFPRKAGKVNRDPIK